MFLGKNLYGYKCIYKWENVPNTSGFLTVQYDFSINMLEEMFTYLHDFCVN